MLSAHIGFTNWNDEDWKYPETVQGAVSDENKLLVHAADSDCFVSEGEVSLPEFTSVGEETYLLQAANAKDALLDVTLTCEDDFVSIRELSCGPQSVRNFEVSVDFSKLTGTKESEILVQAAGCEVKVKVKAVVVTEKLPSMTFVERDGIVSMEAEHFAANESKDGKEWKCLKEYGKTLSSMKVYPMGTNFDKPGEGPSLSYSVLIREGGEYTLRVITAPTNSLEDGRNMRYAVSFDDGSASEVKTVLDEHYNIGGGHSRARDWAEGVLNNCHYGETKVTLDKGVHTIHIYCMESGLVLQKLVLSHEGDVKESYFGPTESGVVR